jgi:hypothetical protein
LKSRCLSDSKKNLLTQQFDSVGLVLLKFDTHLSGSNMLVFKEAVDDAVQLADMASQGQLVYT